MDAPPDPLDELFAAAPDAFVATRDRLAAELAGAGKKGESQALKKVRRPAPSNWATNQVVRRARSAVDELLDATERLRRAQDALLAGRGAQAQYQEGVEALRRATAALSKGARDVLAEAGRADDRHLIERVLANVRAAASSPERRSALLAGRLTADLEPGEELFGATVGAPAPTSAAPEPEPGHDRLLAAAHAEEAAARTAADRTAALAKRARTTRDETTARVEDAERALAAAREALRAADAELRRAERDVARDEKQAEAATRRRQKLQPSR
jgi:hypothetical protein